MDLKHCLRFLALVLLAAEPAAAGAMAPDEVVSAFRQYESLNDDLVVSEGECPCVTEPLRDAVDRYAEGPLQDALDAAERAICETENAAMLRALFQLTLATFDTGSESPALSLGHAFVCRPALVASEFGALQRPDQGPLFEMLGIGFENAVAEHPDAESTNELRERLHALGPAAPK